MSYLLLMFAVQLHMAWLVYRHGKRRDPMSGMLIAMALGMAVGFWSGVHFSNQAGMPYFWATLAAAGTGGFLGWMMGMPAGIPGVVDGFLSGVMGGAMGVMVAVMTPPSDQVLLFRLTSLAAAVICMLIMGVIFQGIPVPPRNVYLSFAAHGLLIGAFLLAVNAAVPHGMYGH